jgi:hypothetical protein
MTSQESAALTLLLKLLERRNLAVSKVHPRLRRIAAIAATIGFGDLGPPEFIGSTVRLVDVNLAFYPA